VLSLYNYHSGLLFWIDRSNACARGLTVRVNIGLEVSPSHSFSSLDDSLQMASRETNKPFKLLLSAILESKNAAAIIRLFANLFLDIKLKAEIVVENVK
jgi:hypothetical protein